MDLYPQYLSKGMSKGPVVHKRIKLQRDSYIVDILTPERRSGGERELHTFGSERRTRGMLSPLVSDKRFQDPRTSILKGGSEVDERTKRGHLKSHTNRIFLNRV